MKCTIKIANVYSTILEETTKELVIEANNKTYIGALFFEPIDEVVKESIQETSFEGSALELMITAYKMLKDNDMLASDDRTFHTMVHWQYMNHLTNDLISELKTYKYRTDSEVFNAYGITV